MPKKPDPWSSILRNCADPQRASHFLELLRGTTAQPTLNRASAEQAKVLAALFAGSQALSSLLVAHPDWLELLEPSSLRFPRRKAGMAQQIQSSLAPLSEAGQWNAALAMLRNFKQQELLRIGTRDLARLSTVPELTQELSDLADVCLDTVWQLSFAQLAQRHGRPYHQDLSGRWHPTTACVLGLGKLGGQELNYSSDVDVIFIYSDEGAVFREPPSAAGPGIRKPGALRTRSAQTMRPVLQNHQFFKRLAEAFIAELTRMAPEGMLYRIDLRLRPEGDLGPLARCLADYENYYAQWGQTWERMMLIKGRGVAGDETLAAEFLEMVQPFRYPRSLSEGVLGEVGAMKDRIENEVVKSGELERNVKLGRGGIREVEFIVQALQLLHAGKQPFLQGAQTLPTLDKLCQYELLPTEAAQVLRPAYIFLRDVEHRLQMEDNRQTHTIPSDRQALLRLARLMQSPGTAQFQTVLRTHTANVRRWFETVLRNEVPSRASSPFPNGFAGTESQWQTLLSQHGFKDVERAFRVLREFVEGPGYVHVSPRTRELALGLLPRLFALCPQPGKPRPSPAPPAGNSGGAVGALLGDRAPLSDPDRVVTRLDSFITAYGARATLFELWARNPGIFELLVLLFDRSEFLAELSIRVPDLVDELVTSGRLRQRKSAPETLRDLRHGLRDADQESWLRRYHQAELMRIGLRDILGLADFEQYLSELSALADACLQYALEVVMRKHRLKTAPFAIIGLGKLGGAEIDYGSDLDIIFVAEPKAANLPRLANWALAVMELLSRRTPEGMVFHTDARLRPDGEKGLLVNTLTAYQQYYRNRAQLWEIQTLTRTRVVAGDLAVGAQFQGFAALLCNFREPSLPLAAYSPDWKQQIHRMRMRIEKERTPVGKNELAIKTGIGGLMDAEFIAQTLCMAQGWPEANTLRALERAREAGLLPGAESLLGAYRKLRRVEGTLRRWSYEGETVLPDDPAPYFRVSVRCGFASPEAFRQALSQWRASIRQSYEQFFATSA